MVVRIPGGFLGQFVLNLGHLGQTGHATPPRRLCKGQCRLSMM